MAIAKKPDAVGSQFDQMHFLTVQFYFLLRRDDDDAKLLFLMRYLFMNLNDIRYCKYPDAPG